MTTAGPTDNDSVPRKRAVTTAQLLSHRPLRLLFEARTLSLFGGFLLDHLGMTRCDIFAYYANHGIALQVHYMPLRKRPLLAGRNVGATHFPELNKVAPGPARLPRFFGLIDAEQQHVIHTALGLLAGKGKYAT